MKEIIEDKVKQGKLKEAISIFLKWEIINNDVRNELILHLARHNQSYRRFIKGLEREEDHKIENNKITLAVLELLNEIERKYLGMPLNELPKSILVAGTGTDAITEKQILTSKILGRFLAENNFTLITGGWRGVDYHVTKEFTETVVKDESQNLFKRLFQIIPKHKEPMYESGNIFYVNQGLDEWTKCLNLADYVILIGGVGGTYSTYKLALRERIPVFPIFDTGGDTLRIKKEMERKKWEETIYSNVGKEEFFKELSININSENDVMKVLNNFKNLKNKIENGSEH